MNPPEARVNPPEAQWIPPEVQWIPPEARRACPDAADPRGLFKKTSGSGIMSRKENLP